MPEGRIGIGWNRPPSPSPIRLVSDDFKEKDYDNEANEEDEGLRCLRWEKEMIFLKTRMKKDFYNDPYSLSVYLFFASSL